MRDKSEYHEQNVIVSLCGGEMARGDGFVGCCTCCAVAPAAGGVGSARAADDNGGMTTTLLLHIVVAVVCGVVCVETLVLFAHLRQFRRLDDVTVDDDRKTWPKVSILMAAKDEGADVARAVRSRLDDDYPNLELVFVDDRSDDDTGVQAQQAAAGDERFVFVRVDELPGGWLGKVHALHVGQQRATGDWLLLSDGDVTTEQGTLRKCVSYAERDGRDMLAVLPSYRTGSFVMDMVWAVVVRGFMVMMSPKKVRSSSSKAAMGSGAFNFMRRASWLETEGFAHIRMETADDLAAGQMMKRAGAKCDFVDGSRLIQVPMYRSLAQFFTGIEKNGSTTARVPWPLVVVGMAVFWSVWLTPLVALGWGLASSTTWVSLVGGASFGFYTFGECVAWWRNRRQWLPALCWPLGAMLFSVGFVRSTALAQRHNGVRWRGTFYTLDELNAGRRLQM